MQNDWGGSFITTVFILVAVFGALKAALEIAVARWAHFPRMDPVERNLQRVSHSMAYILATGAIILGGYGPQATRVYLYIYTGLFPYSPAAVYGLPLIAAAVVAIGVIRIRTARRAFRFFNPEFHEHATIMRSQAAVKAVGGLGGLLYLTLRHDAYIYAGGWWWLTYQAVWLLAAWCAVVGPVRLFLLRRRRADDLNIDPPEWHWE